MLASSMLLLLVVISLTASSHQDSQTDNSQVFDGPYIQVYPPVDLSQDQQSCFPQNSSTGTCPLFIGLLMSFGGDYTSSGSIPGVQLALDEINANPNLLPGYTLHYTLLDSMCQRTSALDALLPQLIHPPTKIGIIGAGCSVATEPTAELSHYFNLTQISCVSSSNELANRERYRYYFQLLADEADSAFGFFEIIRYFKWKKIAFIVQDENLFTLTIDRLKMLLTDDESINVTITMETRFRSEDGIESLGENPFDMEARIFILSMYEPRARELLCRAHQNGIRYPRYLLIVIGWYAPNWWIGSEEEQNEVLKNFGCNATERESVLPHTLSPLQSEFITDFTTIVDSGINGSTYELLYQYYLEQFPFNITDQIYSQQCYDATWTLAAALNRTITNISQNASFQEYLKQFHSDLNLSPGEEFGLQHFTYNNSGMVSSIFNNIQAAEITGITGHVQFNESTGVRTIGIANVYSYLYDYDEDGKRVLHVKDVGLVHFSNRTNVTFEFTNGHSEDTIWGDAGRPYDGVAEEQDVTVSIPLAVIFIILALAGIIFAIVCLVFNITYKNRKLIKLSSPNLNLNIGLGAIILYLDFICFVVPTTNRTAVAVLCNITPWLTALGYSLCFGTIVAKMFRVYYIFNNPTPNISKKKTIIVKDWMLVLGVLLLLVIDVIILLTYTAVEGSRGNLITKRIPSRENPQDITGARGVITEYYIYVCDSQSREITLGILYGYKALLQIIALVFTFSIRKVKIEGLNDAIYITVAVYVSSIVTAVIFVSTYTLKELVNAYAAVFSGGFLVGTTGILILVFVPKMVFLYFDPQGENVFNSEHFDLAGSLNNRFIVRSKDDIIAELRTQVDKLLKEKHERSQGEQVSVEVQN